MGIPAGTKYEVTEDDLSVPLTVAGYSKGTIDNGSGTVADKTTSEVTVNNKFTEKKSTPTPTPSATPTATATPTPTSTPTSTSTPTPTTPSAVVTTGEGGRGYMLVASGALLALGIGAALIRRKRLNR